MTKRRWFTGACIALPAAALASVFYIDLCNLIYRCGCGHLWAGAVAQCNIHTPGVKHCPWCAVGTMGGMLLFAGVVAPQILLAFFPARWSWKQRFAAALAAFPVIGGIEGLVMGLVTGYWD
jgi:hypothetical protein